MKERRVKFKEKVTAWCGNCSFRVKFKFVGKYEKKDLKLKESDKQKDKKKEYDKLSDKEKDLYKKTKLNAYKHGIYQCLDCDELKVLEFPEPF